MRKNVNQLPVDDLLKNSQWVRHLALSLLHDKNLVDDVVQEVWAKAVERPPEKLQALPLWLKKVVRSVAFRANRVLVLRHRAEMRHPAAKVETSPDEIAEQLEIQRLLTALVKPSHRTGPLIPQPCTRRHPKRPGRCAARSRITKGVGVPDRIRTCDPLLRRQPLYPLSYRDAK